MKRLGLILSGAWSALASGILLASVTGFLVSPSHVYACLPPRDLQMFYLWAGAVLVDALLLAGITLFCIIKLKE